MKGKHRKWPETTMREKMTREDARLIRGLVRKYPAHLIAAEMSYSIWRWARGVMVGEPLRRYMALGDKWREVGKGLEGYYRGSDYYKTK